MADLSDYMVPYGYNADGVTINSRPEPVPQWYYFQFMFRDGEAVVVVDPQGNQHKFYVNPDGNLRPMSHQCKVRPGPISLHGKYFDLQLNGGRSIIKMQMGKDGICRGTRDHWKGKWTLVTKTTMQMSAQGLRQPDTLRPWDRRNMSPVYTDEFGMYHHAPVADAYADPKTNPLGISKHPSGLSEHDLEPCKACDHNQGACYECYNTGMVPKNSSKGNDIMNTAEMIAVIQIQQGAKIVSAVYVSNGETPAAPPGVEQRVYHFKNVAALPLAKGDLIVVQTRAGYSLATVVDPDLRANACECPLGQLKHVVNRVDLEALNTVLEGENNAMHALALSEVTERMNKFKEQIGADTFSSMAALLAPPTNKE